MKYCHVFWDWNGTIFNDALTAHVAVNIMLKKRDLPLISFEQYKDYVDVPIARFYERVMDMSKETLEGLSVEFNALWKENLPENPFSDGVIDVLKYLNQNGIKQYIFSSSQNKYIVPYLEYYGIDNYFTAILGATDCQVGSKVERTRMYLTENSISPSDALFIGDMAHDSDVATAIGADCILLSSGHQCESALKKTGRPIISSINELIQNIQ